MVEIVAIVIAGLWAFYIFAYENRIKPSLTDPQVQFTATMTKVAERNGFAAVQLNTEIRNIGQVPAHLIGYAIWVYGRRIVPLRQARDASGEHGALFLDGAFYRVLPRTPVYGYGYITVLGDPTQTADLLLEPGDDEKSQDVFYVPVNRFELLEAFVHARYTKNDERTIPTKLVLNRDKLPIYIGSHSGNFDFSNIVSRINIM